MCSSSPSRPRPYRPSTSAPTVLISMPVISRGPAGRRGPDARASRSSAVPASVSWSVIATTAIPYAVIWRSSSAGVRTPSDRLRVGVQVDPVAPRAWSPVDHAADALHGDRPAPLPRRDVDEQGVEHDRPACRPRSVSAGRSGSAAGPSPGAKPMTESIGPVMPRSLTYAVPRGRIRASAVGTCVWVPTTALTWPSRWRPNAVFSLVTSQWKSTRRTGGSSSAPSSSRRATSVNGFSMGCMYVRPWAEMTTTSVPSTAWKMPQPRPGHAVAGRS